MRRAALRLASVPLLAGCAYFNGVYNARQAEKHGDAMRRTGRSAEADSLYTIAAQKAESVLAHYPKSRWTDDALFIAGWAWAMSDRCDRAEPRLVAFLARGGGDEERFARALLARGVCRVREQDYREARAMLAPVTQVADKRIAGDAALWAAVASIRLGEPDSARVYLRHANAGRAEWELARVFLAMGRAAEAESVLARRAAHGDYRPDLLAALRTLWQRGRAAGVERIVARYDASRTSAEDRARLHVAVGQLALDAQHDSAARAHFAAAARLTRDTLVQRDAAAHLTLAELHDLTSIADVETVIARGRARGAGSALQRRLEDNVLLLQMLHDRDDGSGAALFLAAEVARDSLRAPALSGALFQEVAALPRSSLAAKALLAVAQLDRGERRSADTTLVAGASFGVVAPPAAEGGDSTLTYDPVEQLLARTWATVVAQYTDSLKRLRPDSAAAAAGSTGTPGSAQLPAGRRPDSLSVPE
jgi:hypothetical protein